MERATVTILFGRTISSSGTSATANTLRFSSKQIHDNALLFSTIYYYGYRFYDPSTQRWLNRDPAGERERPNLYSHTRNNPINALDLWGLESRLLMLALAADSSFAIEPGVGISQVRDFYGPTQITGLRVLLDQCPCKVPNWKNIEIGVDFDMEERGHGGIVTAERSIATYYDDQMLDDVSSALQAIKGKFPMGFVPVIFTADRLASKGADATGATIGSSGIIMHTAAAQTTLGHEIGHYAGYSYKGERHHPDEMNLMYEKEGRSVFVDEIWCNAVADLAARQGFTSPRNLYSGHYSRPSCVRSPG